MKPTVRTARAARDTKKSWEKGVYRSTTWALEAGNKVEPMVDNVGPVMSSW